ncbi:MAG: hypothetical protein QOK26_3890 [Pseudonocardiales bacterium]|jgi:hypothetical protein|nr:hypothetical protein [Pseudonocardiales bacterium]
MLSFECQLRLCGRILALKRWTLPRAGATRHEDGPTTNLTSSASTRDNIARAT